MILKTTAQQIIASTNISVNNACLQIRFCGFCHLVVRVVDLEQKVRGFDPWPVHGEFTLGQDTLHIYVPLHPGI